jgi:hypothetical protein
MHREGGGALADGGGLEVVSVDEASIAVSEVPEGVRAATVERN